MIALRSLAVCAIAAAAVACDKEATFVEPLPDYAAIHWVNAVPDTMAQNFRIVDMVSNAGMFGAAFRSTTPFYQPIEAGSRTLRIFLSSTDVTIAQTVLREDALALTSAASYTYVHMGFARTGQTPARNGVLIPDAPPAVAGDSVVIRFINAAAGLGTLDLNILRRGSDTLPDVPLANVAFGAASAYVKFKSDSMRVFHPRVGVDSIVFYDTLRVVATAPGTKTPRLFTTVLPLGTPNTINTGPIQPIAGAALKGSVMTAVITPRSVAGSAAPQTAAFQVPAPVILFERRPALIDPAP
jgi:hypothetical protein